MAQTTPPPPDHSAAPTPAPAGAPPADSGRYVLLAPHAIGDAIYPQGTEVGADTGIRFPGPPSNQMQGIDGKGKAAVDQLFKDVYGKRAPWALPDWPVADPEGVRKKQDEEAKSAPVSYQQALERGAKEFAGKPVTGPLPPPSPMPLSGDKTISLGAPLPFAVPPQPAF